MFSVHEARTRVLGTVDAMGTVAVPVAEALGRVSARDYHAPHALPRFDNSAMDGYAVVASDLREAGGETPVELEVIGEIRAGSGEAPVVGPGTAVRIMTGAPLPKGADAVIPVEMTSEENDRVSARGTVVTGQHVRPAGDDLEAGDLLVGAGSEIASGEIALLASMGCSPLEVFEVPRVAVLVTGDELVPPEQDPGPGQIRDSNSVALAALVSEAGARTVHTGRVPDTLDSTVAALQEAARTADLVVSSGGVAVGRYDFVKAAVESLGRIDMWKVAMQPGKPVVLGVLGDIPFLGLPGNPVSIHISFEQFVRPALRKMRGLNDLLRPVLTARLKESVSKRRGRLHFVRVKLSRGPAGWEAIPLAQGSHIQSSLVGVHGVARVDEEVEFLDAGSDVEVEVWRLPGGNDE